MGKVTFNGISSEDLGLIIQTPPTYVFPERDMETVHIQNRNGDLAIDKGCYKNVDRTYSIAKVFNINEKHYEANAQEILKWLTSAKGKYARLTDSYDSSVFRQAMFYSNGSFTNIHGEALTVSVTFRCKPQRYLICGEAPIEMTLNNDTYGKTCSIENMYGQESLPKIKIGGLDAVLQDLDKIVMLTVRDTEKVTASITISKLGVEQGGMLGELSIDSENESVYGSDEKDRYSCIGLNGKNFPKLNDGVNTINIAQYEIEEWSATKSPESGYNLPTYSSMLINNQEVVICKYMSKKDLEVEREDKMNIKSYNMLIASKQIRYPAKSVQSYVDDVSEKYEFVSFNSILDAIGSEYTFVGNFDEIAAEQPSNNIKNPTAWLKLVRNPNGTTEMWSRQAGYFYIKDKDNKIKYYAADEDLGLASSSKTTNIRYYPSEPITDENDVVIGQKLAAEFANVPNWLTYEIICESNEPYYAPIQVNFVMTKRGYLWRDKDNLFGKAGWKYHGDPTSKSSNIYEVLDSIIWDSSKKAFVSKKGILPSTNTTITYKYVPQLPQYENIIATSVDEDGEEVETVTAVPMFDVIDVTGGDKTLSAIKIIAKEAGYFKIVVAGAKEAHWSSDKIAQGEQVEVIKGTENFDIYYLADKPDYSDSYIDETGKNLWPEWLDAVPELQEDGTHGPLEPTAVGFKVKYTSNYRHSKVDNPDELTAWQSVNVNNYIWFSNINGKEAYKVPITICKLDDIPNELPFDRQYLQSNGEPYDYGEKPVPLPSWFSVQYYTSKDFAEGTELLTDADYRAYIAEHPKKEIYVRFKTNIVAPAEEGYYKWDSNVAWLRKTSNEDMLRSSLKDTTTLYYLSELPQYGTYGNFKVEPKPDSSGNPVSVTYTVLVAGYYRANSNSDWVWYEANKEILNVKISESVVIRHLKNIENQQEDPLANIAITIVPRWWML